MRRLLDRLRLRRSIHEELEACIEEKVDDLVASGVPEVEARLRARREFGNTAALAERSREALGWTWLERLAQDLRYAVRTLRRSPVFTLAAVLSLALGIGANTAIFGLLDTIAWKMLPVREPEKLWTVAAREATRAVRGGQTHSYPLYALWRDHSRAFEGLAAYSTFTWKDKSVTSDQAWHAGEYVSGNYFDLLGVPALAGRVLAPADDSIEGEGGAQGAVAVLGYGYWRRAFNPAESALGRPINVNGVWFTVAGVAPPEFSGMQVGTSPDVYVPLHVQPVLYPGANLLHVTPTSETTWLNLIGRLKPGLAPAQAVADLLPIYEPYWVSRLHPDDQALYYAKKKPLNRTITLEAAGRGFSRLRDTFTEPLRVLMALVGIVLLIACANLANLMLARSSARQKEIAVRLAIGAGRLRLVRQLVTESLVLATAGGALGVLFALWGSRLLIHMLPQGQIPVVLEVGPDHRLLGFALAVSLATGVLFGLGPALRATRLGPAAALGQAGAAAGPSGQFDLNHAMVVTGIALSVPLVAGAGLFLTTLRNLAAIDTGFAQKNVLQLSMNIEGTGIPRQQWKTVYDQVAAQVSGVPGVVAASLSNRGLMESGTSTSGPLQVPGYAFRPGEKPQLREFIVGEGYFAAAGVPLRLGRDFTARDGAGTPKVAIVNEEFARHYLGGRAPLGVRYAIGRPATSIEIVGVVGDAKYNDLRQDPIPMAYYPWPQQMGDPPTRLNSVIVRARGESAALAAALQRAVRAVHPDLFLDVRTLASQIDATLLRERLLARLSGFFGGLALLLACIGLYGVMSYGVTRRTSEMGVRTALGAAPGDVVRLVLRETFLLAAAGIAIGVPLALWMTRAASSMLYGLQPNDPWVLAAAAGSLFVVCLLAGWIPARRAGRIDPVTALRHQ
jgi:predicted permease